MKTKLFYHSYWETGDEIRDEFRSWLESIEKDKDIRNFRLVAKSKKGNWLRVVYEYETFKVY